MHVWGSVEGGAAQPEKEAVSTVCAPICKPDLRVVQAVASHSNAVIARPPCSWRLDKLTARKVNICHLLCLLVL